MDIVRPPLERKSELRNSSQLPGRLPEGNPTYDIVGASWPHGDCAHDQENVRRLILRTGDNSIERSFSGAIPCQN